MSDGVVIAAIGTAGTVVGAVVTALVNRAQRPTPGTDSGSSQVVRHVGRYDGVAFSFLVENEDNEWENGEVTGTVVVRDGEMVLDIPGKRGGGPYLIAGKAHGHRFQGVSTARGRSKRVEAAWADFGERYLGWWVEDGNRFLFSFTLPKL